MTAGEWSGLITVLVALGGFFLSMRSTSYAELKGLFDTLRTDFDKYKIQTEAKEAKYEKKIEEMQNEIDTLTKQGDNYKRYITRLIAQLERAQIIPVKMDEDK